MALIFNHKLQSNKTSGNLPKTSEYFANSLSVEKNVLYRENKPNARNAITPSWSNITMYDILKSHHFAILTVAFRKNTRPILAL